MSHALHRLAETTLISLACAASAAPLPKEGRYDVTTCWSGVANELNHSKEHFASSYEMTGTVLSNPPGGLFHNSAFRCVGMSTALAGKRSNTTLCESIDPDGDRRLSYFFLGTDGKTMRENVTGTGKYEGMVATGDVQQFGRFPVIKPGTFQGCNQQSGTYQLKRAPD
jgi:hypothetical protein